MNKHAFVRLQGVFTTVYILGMRRSPTEMKVTFSAIGVGAPFFKVTAAEAKTGDPSVRNKHFYIILGM